VDPNVGETVVMSTFANGPARLGGVLPGDAVLEVDGQVEENRTGSVVAPTFTSRLYRQRLSPSPPRCLVFLRTLVFY
jgi:C-terminal processing protease CtpA/Prc